MSRVAFVLLALMTLAAAPVAADNKLPWFGSADQAPFQVTESGSIVETREHNGFAPDTADACTIVSCFEGESTTRVLKASSLSP